MSFLPEILVMGDGIAGRAIALAWAQSGGSTKIVAPQKTPQSTSPIMGGVQLAPNGWSALKTLGLDDTAHMITCPLSMMRLLSCETGNTLVHIDLTQSHRRPYTAVSRDGLMTMLADACAKTSRGTPRVTWHDGIAERVVSDADAATLTLEDGTTLSAPYIFGADGAMGMTRAFVKAEDETPRPALSSHLVSRPGSRLAYRLVIPLDELPDYFAAQATSVWLGSGVHMVFYPLRSGQLNIVLVTGSGSGVSASRQIPPSAPSSAVMSILRTQPILAPLIPYLDGVNPMPLYRHSPLDALRRGRVLLCGDAAHPMPPHLAQGAGQSLIDAAHLKTRLTIMLQSGHSDDHDLNTMLTGWTASRLKATKSIQQKADRAGRLFSIDGPLVRVRNFGLSTLGGVAIEAELDKIWQS